MAATAFSSPAHLRGVGRQTLEHDAATLGLHMGAHELRAVGLQTIRVGINGVGGDLFAPFGGYKRGGNGREWGEYGFNEFVELKAVLGAM